MLTRISNEKSACRNLAIAYPRFWEDDGQGGNNPQCESHAVRGVWMVYETRRRILVSCQHGVQSNGLLNQTSPSMRDMSISSQPA